MYPDTILGWFIGTFIVLLIMVGMTMLAYFTGHWLEKHSHRRDKEDEE